MKRSDFFKSIFGAAAVVALPNQLHAVESEKEYSFNEIFEIHKGNEKLIYPKRDCEIYQKIKELIGNERILEEKYFTCYLPFRYNFIPVKDKYSISDFMPFILCAKSYYQKHWNFSEHEKGVFFRMFKESPEAMHFDTFAGDVRGQYHD